MPTVDTAVRLIRRLDDEIEAIEAEAKNKVNALTLKRKDIEIWLAKKAAEDGVDSFKTSHGTIYWSTTNYCSVANWDSIWNYIKNNEAWHLLTHAVSKKAIGEIVQDTGNVPPGLNYGVKRTLCVRKPTSKE